MQKEYDFQYIHVNWLSFTDQSSPQLVSSPNE